MVAIKDLFALHDDALDEVFSRKAHDPSKARAAIIKGITRTKSQFDSATPVRGRKWFKIGNGIVETNLPFAVEGKSRFLTPSERYPTFLDTLHKLVDSGSLDKEIEAGRPDTGIDGGSASSGSGTGKGPKKGSQWSPARREAHQARMAAKKAAK